MANKAALKANLEAAITAELTRLVESHPAEQTLTGKYDNSDLGLQGQVTVSG
jgi:hypothetical protein